MPRRVRQSGLLVGVDHRVPARRVILGRCPATPAQHGPEQEVLAGRRIRRAVLELGHLADLLVGGHLGKQCLDACLHGLRGVVPIDDGGDRRRSDARKRRDRGRVACTGEQHEGDGDRQPAPRADHASKYAVAPERGVWKWRID